MQRQIHARWLALGLTIMLVSIASIVVVPAMGATPEGHRPGEGDFQVVDLTAPDWEQRLAEALSQAGDGRRTELIERARELRERPRVDSGPTRKLVAANPPAVLPGETDDMSYDTYVNCGYNQHGWVMQELSGPSQGYGFWQGIVWPWGTPFTNPNIYSYCESSLCMGVAHYWYFGRAPKVWSMTWDGFFAPFDQWCE